MNASVPIITIKRASAEIKHKEYRGHKSEQRMNCIANQTAIIREIKDPHKQSNITGTETECYVPVEMS